MKTTKIISILMAIAILALALTGCARNVSQDTAVAKDDSLTSDVTKSIDDANNLTSLDDSSLDVNLGSADKALADW